MEIQSKLPHVGTTIFTVMSALAHQHKAVNLSQGFPDFDCSSDLVDLVHHYMTKGLNQYSPMAGVKELREVISGKFSSLYNSEYHPDKEITITSGGSEAIFSIIASVVHAGDEVIIFEPAYDLYRPIIELFGGIVKASELKGPDFKPNWEEVKELISPKTRLIILNNPNNPSTSVLEEKDLNELENLLKNTNISLLSDEVYEHIVYDGKKHQSVSQFSGLKERSFIVASFGKLFHITGWKVGYIAAPVKLTAEMRKVHQFNVFCVNTPIQYALADFLKREEEYLNLAGFFQKKRDFFMKGLEQTPFKVLNPEGSYFLLADYSEISDLNEAEFSKWLTQEYGVAVIPVSAFYKNPPKHQKLVRFCFAKKEETLEKALNNLVKL